MVNVVQAYEVVRINKWAKEVKPMVMARQLVAMSFT